MFVRLLPALVVLVMLPLGSAAHASLPRVLGAEDGLTLLDDELALDPINDITEAPLAAAIVADGDIAAERLDLAPRGALLDRCRMRMRRVLEIGHNASPDGRPAACRLLSFLRPWRTKYAFLRRRSRVRPQTIGDRGPSFFLDPTPGPIRVSARSVMHHYAFVTPAHFFTLFAAINSMRAPAPIPPRR